MLDAASKFRNPHTSHGCGRGRSAERIRAGGHADARHSVDAHYLNRADKPIVGYLTDEHGRPILQGPNDPFPGYYISQTAFSDIQNQNERDPRRYVDARKINYVVRGNAARRHGVKVGDFVAVYSKRTHKSVFAYRRGHRKSYGDEGSLHLLQDLGYPFQTARMSRLKNARS